MDLFWDFVGSWTFIVMLVALLVAMILGPPLIIILFFIRAVDKHERSSHDS
jgi:hypothetical protein